MASQILDQLLADIKTAMKAREKDKLLTLRTLHAQIKNVQINERREVTDADVAAIIAKGIKQRQEAIEQFGKAGRDDLVTKEQAEVELFQSYQPKQLTRDEIEELARSSIAEAGAVSRKDMGKVMRIIMPQVKGRADGKLVNQVVASLLP